MQLNWKPIVCYFIEIYFIVSEYLIYKSWWLKCTTADEMDFSSFDSLTNEWLQKIRVDGSIFTGLDATNTLACLWSVTIFVGLVVGPVSFAV